MLSISGGSRVNLQCGRAATACIRAHTPVCSAFAMFSPSHDKPLRLLHDGLQTDLQKDSLSATVYGSNMAVAGNARIKTPKEKSSTLRINKGHSVSNLFLYSTYCNIILSKYLNTLFIYKSIIIKTMNLIHTAKYRPNCSKEYSVLEVPSYTKFSVLLNSYIYSVLDCTCMMCSQLNCIDYNLLHSHFLIM